MSMFKVLSIKRPHSSNILMHACCIRVVYWSEINRGISSRGDSHVIFRGCVSSESASGVPSSIDMAEYSVDGGKFFRRTNPLQAIGLMYCGLDPHQKYFDSLQDLQKHLGLTL